MMQFKPGSRSEGGLSTALNPPPRVEPQPINSSLPQLPNKKQQRAAQLHSRQGQAEQLYLKLVG